MIPSVLFAASFKLRSLRSSHKLIAIQIFLFEYMNFLNIIHEEDFFVKKSLENVLQRNLGTERAKECVFRVSGGTNFENFSA